MWRCRPVSVLSLVAVAFAVLACGPVPGISGESANLGGVLPPATARPSGLDAYLELPDDVEQVVFPYSEVTIEREAGVLTLGVLVANTGERRQRGLMYWTGLPAQMGMIFIWEGGGERYGGFWNQNVPMDLSVAFLDRDGVVMEFVTLYAQDDEVKAPAQAYAYALEVPRGRFEQLGIRVGDRVRIPQSLWAE